MYAQKGYKARHVWPILYPLDILKYLEDIRWHTISTKLRIADIR
jgi:hypothetical protein